MPFMISIDGQRAPMFEHATFEDALIEAKRLSPSLKPGSKIRVLREEVVLTNQANYRLGVHDESPDGWREHKISVDTALKVFG